MYEDKETLIRENLEKLAKQNNRFAKMQINCDETGLSANFEALMEKQCTHSFGTLNGSQIRVGFSESVRIVNDWAIQEKICPFCGKTLQKTIKKVKEVENK